MADVFDEDSQNFRPGTRARVSLPSHKKSLSAIVSEVLPQFDASSRTLKVRLEIDNPDYVLRPDMFVDVELLVAYSDVIAVPVDAVLDSGLKKTVYVDRGEGSFEPREVETGRRFTGRVEILRGLEPGERIASAGTFMLDSETRMKQTTTAVHDEMTKDPVCGMGLQAAKAGARMEYQGVMRYFCSPKCKNKFVNNPHGYLANENVARAGKTID
jgi:Cu(I)/Ag(I) efflux system membrane fusion protein